MVSNSGNRDEGDGISAPTQTIIDDTTDGSPRIISSLDAGGATEKFESRTNTTDSAATTATTKSIDASDQEQKPQTQAIDGLSKNRRKKLEKRERARQKKLERKAAEKAERLATAIAQGRDLSAEKKFVEERTLSGDRRRRLDELWDSKQKEAEAENRFEICIDLGARGCLRNGDEDGNGTDETGGKLMKIRAAFEEAMREQEIASLAHQIRYCYSYNKKSPNPVVTAVTGLSKKRKIPTKDNNNASGYDFPTVREHLERETGFHEWNRRMFDCTEQTLEEHYGGTTTLDATSRQETLEIAPGSPSIPLDQPRQKNIVYLTSDSQTTLERLEENTVYVIGGIVDRNRLKRATIDRAENELNVETAKLPLQEYLRANNISMTTTKVLTVNHVFDILLKYRQHGNNWDKAFGEILPSRKV